MMTADRRKKHCCTNKAIPTSSPNGVQILRTVEMKGSKWQGQSGRAKNKDRNDSYTVTEATSEIVVK